MRKIFFIYFLYIYISYIFNGPLKFGSSICIESKNQRFAERSGPYSLTLYTLFSVAE